MKDEHKIIALSVFAGVGLWVTDAAIDSVWFSKMPFPDRLLFGLSCDEIYFRTLFLASFFFFGLVCAKLISRKNKAEEELKVALREARREQQKTAAVMEAIGDAISIQDREFRILYQNRAHKELMGDHAGEFCYKAYGKEESVCPDCHLQLTFRDGKIRQVERSSISPNGPVDVDITSSPVFSGGSVIMAVEVVRDATLRKNAERKREKLISELQKALSEIKTLRGLIPICAWCKKVRNDSGYWENVEEYLQKNSEARFTHGVCSECVSKAWKEETGGKD